MQRATTIGIQTCGARVQRLKYSLGSSSDRRAWWMLARLYQARDRATPTIADLYAFARCCLRPI